MRAVAPLTLPYPRAGGSFSLLDNTHNLCAHYMGCLVSQNVDYDTFKNMVAVAHLKPIHAANTAQSGGCGGVV